MLSLGHALFYRWLALTFVRPVLQVLNRAVAEDPFAAKDKKLASGKTFVKKV